MTISKSTRQKINWQRIEDSAIGLATRGGDPTSPKAAHEPSPVPDLIPIFGTARQEFQKALASLEFTSRMPVIVAGLSVVASLGGVVVAAAWKQVIGGAVFTGAGTVSLLALFSKIQGIGRDQAL